MYENGDFTTTKNTRNGRFRQKYLKFIHGLLGRNAEIPKTNGQLQWSVSTPIGMLCTNEYNFNYWNSVFRRAVENDIVLPTAAVYR